jgi:hypothetical protein
MKIFFLLILIFANNCTAVSQILNGFVIDHNSGNKLSLANIALLQSNVGTNTNLEGYFKINIKNHLDDSIKVSHVGYQSKNIALRQFEELKTHNLRIELAKKPIELSEVNLFRKNIIYTQKQILGEKRNENVSMFSLVGFETACLIKNPFKKKGKLNSIKLDIKKNREANFIAKFKIKIYQFNENLNQPGEALTTQNLLISPKNKNYKLSIDLSQYNIPFPKEGICVGIELIDINNEAKKGNKIGPGLRFTYGEQESLTFYNYRDKGWHKGYLNPKNNSGNLIVGIVVMMPK